MIDFFKNDRAYDINSYEKTLVEKVKLVEQLNEEHKRSIYIFIDLAIGNQRLKDTFNKAAAFLE